MSSVDKRIIEHPASTELYNDDWFIKDSVVEGTTKISGVNLKELLGADGTQALEEIANAIAEEYDSTHTYTYNNWAFHEGVLHRCIANNVTGPWDATKWQAKTIKEFIADSENLITSRLRAMFGEYLPISTLDPPSIEAISKGDIFIYQRTNKYKFYRAKVDHPQGVTEFDIDDWDEFDTVADLIEDVTENAGKVADVQVKTTDDYETVVDNKIAKIDLSSVTAYGEVPNLPQPIASFSDGAVAPMMSLKVGIEPQQDLHGYDAPWAGGAGLNKYPILIGADEFNDNASATHTNNDGVLVIDATATNDSGAYSKSTSTIMGLVGHYSESITYSFDIKANISGSVLVGYSDVGRKTVDLTTNWQRVTITDTAVGTNKAFVIYNRSGSAIEIQVKNFMFELGSVVHPYEPYSNECPISGWSEANVTVADDVETPTVSNVYTIDLDGTRYGGELDVVNGVLTLTDGFISSYNGETLPSTWISDRDVYAEGTTPTTGAEVCYKLATPQTIQLTPTAVKSLLGQNNIWADTGDIDKAEYQRDATTIINELIARIEALEG